MEAISNSLTIYSRQIQTERLVYCIKWINIKALKKTLHLFLEKLTLYELWYAFVN